jgi:hypothetical protein
MTVTIGRRELLAALGGAAMWPRAARAAGPRPRSDCREGRAIVSLVAARPRRVLLLWCISGSRAIPGHCRAIHVPSSFLKAKGIERGWL